MRMQELIKGPTPVSRDVQEVYFKSIVFAQQTFAALQQAVQDAKGNEAELKRQLFIAAARLRFLAYQAGN
jgi:hypothetical protein